MRVSIISDEISRDPLTASEIAASWGLKHLELRSFYGDRAPRGMTASDVETVRSSAEQFGLDVPSISPGLFKITLDDERIDAHRGDLRVQCLDMAEMLGATTMVVFPHVRPSPETPDDAWPPEVVEDLRETARMAADRNITVALETEKPCYGASGQSMRKLIEVIDEPNCGANWDPANHHAYTGESFEAGYEALRDVLVHVHVKDARIEDGERTVVPAGEGEIGWRAQVRALIEDGYDGLMVVETHFRPKVAGSRAATEALMDILREAGEPIE